MNKIMNPSKNIIEQTYVGFFEEAYKFAWFMINISPSGVFIEG